MWGIMQSIMDSISLKPLIRGWVIGLIFLIALVGFADATYLAVVHFQGGTPPCSVLKGCEVVTTSKYATIGPVPVALLGSIFYFAVLATVMAYWDSRSRRVAAILPVLGLIGFGVSVILVGLQVFVIKAICMYCIASATSSTAIFLLGASLLQFKRHVQ